MGLVRADTEFHIELDGVPFFVTPEQIWEDDDPVVRRFAESFSPVAATVNRHRPSADQSVGRRK